MNADYGQTELGLNLYDFHARQFDPALGRWLAADPQNQFMSPYLGMGNIPTLVVDPDGEFGFIAAGFALFGAINSGINSRKNGDGFLSGFLQSFALSAVSAGFAAGVGESLGAVGGLGKEIGRAALHAGSSGFSSVLGGGSFLSGAGAGFTGSLYGSLTDNFEPHWQILGSSISGGVGAELAGGGLLAGS